MVSDVKSSLMRILMILLGTLGHEVQRYTLVEEDSIVIVWIYR